MVANAPAIILVGTVIYISNGLNWSLLVLRDIVERFCDHVLGKQLT